MAGSAEPELKARLESLEALKGLSAVEVCGCPVFTLPPERLIEVTEALKTAPELQFDHLSLLTAVDRVDHIDLIYVLDSDTRQTSVQLTVPLDFLKPAAPSLTALWAAAAWLEREIAEMFGVEFTGHPDPRHLLLLDNFRGYPLLKRFTATDPEGLFD